MKKIRDLTTSKLDGAILTISLIIGVIAFRLQPAEINSQDFYYSISGSMAAIFAIVFSIIVLFISTLEIKYKALKIIINNKRFKYAYLLFIIGIIFPLFVVKTDYNILKVFCIENSTAANLSKAISITFLVYGCLVLIPLLEYIFQILIYERFEKLKYKKNDVLSKNEMEEKTIDLLDLREDIIKLNYRFYHGLFIDELRDIVFKSVEKDWTKPIEDILLDIKDTENIINYNDSLAEMDISKIFNWITQIGIKATEKKLMISPELPVAYYSVDALGKIGVEAAMKNLKSQTVRLSQDGLLRIGIKAAEVQLKCSDDELRFQQKIGKRLIIIYKKTEDKQIQENSIKCLWLLSASIHLHLQGAFNDWIIEMKNQLKDDESMRKVFESTYPDAEKLCKQFSTKFHEMYLFIWENIPGNNEGKLIDFIYRDFGISWAKTGTIIIKKSDENTIIVSNGKRSLSLKLNDEKSKVNLEIDDGRPEELIVQFDSDKNHKIYPNIEKSLKKVRDSFYEEKKITLPPEKPEINQK